jgi:predicted nucleic acid-binding protein
LQHTNILDFNQNVARKAVDINHELKKKRKQIEMADLFIAATAIAYHLPIATLNKKHFERIDHLNIIE